MSETTTQVNFAGGDARPFADPARFGALVARIDNEIESLSRDRRHLALARRNVAVICAIYAAVALCVQDALRSELARPKAAPRPVAVRHPSAGLPPSVASLPPHGVTLTTASAL